MTAAFVPQTQPDQRDPAAIVRAGGWLFRHRTITPVPLALAVLLVPAPQADGQPLLAVLGFLVVALGEATRLWGVRHIGTVSRTRSDRLGPLVASGPFAHVRNPLYLGNIALWTGFAISAQLLWLAPIFIAVLALEYHAIVRWEERLLEERIGDGYRAYAATVPRWVPAIGDARAASGPNIPSRPTTSALFSWRDTFYSERGTLIAIAVGFGLLYLKHRI
jgi:protein-S-isoprenylcysteine O-methyltransferase Ste14